MRRALGKGCLFLQVLALGGIQGHSTEHQYLSEGEEEGGGGWRETWRVFYVIRFTEVSMGKERQFKVH